MVFQTFRNFFSAPALTGVPKAMGVAQGYQDQDLHGCPSSKSSVHLSLPTSPTSSTSTDPKRLTLNMLRHDPRRQIKMWAILEPRLKARHASQQIKKRDGWVDDGARSIMEVMEQRRYEIVQMKWILRTKHIKNLSLFLLNVQPGKEDIIQVHWNIPRGVRQWELKEIRVDKLK